MKNIKYCLVIIFMFIFRLNVGATNLDMSISCPSTAYTGDNVSCTINANSNDGSVNGINANFSIENATFKSFNPTDGWSAYNNSSNGFAIGNINGASGSNAVGILNIHIDGAAGSTVKVELNNIGASDMDYSDISVSNTFTNINIIEKTTVTSTTTTNITTTKKKVLTLNDLAIEGYDIKFDKNTFEYSIDVDYDVSMLKINASSDKNNTITGIGDINIDEGENILEIKVTNLDKETSTYTITVNRVVKVSNIVQNNIDDINNAYKSNKELIVNLNSESDQLVISQPVIDTIKNTDRKITYNILKDNEILYYYEFNGEKFTETYNDINLKLNFISNDETLENLINDDKKIIFENEYKSYFPTGTKINIKNTKNISTNKDIGVYKVNIENNLELISSKANVKDNFIGFEIEKGSKYVLFNKKDKLKNSNLLLIIIASILFIEIIIVGVLLLIKIKSNKIVN